MREPREKLWDYDAVEPGQDGAPTVVALTAAHIAAYARLAQNADPRFQRSGANAEYDGALVAMPTMVLAYAPLLRGEIAERHGFVALEESETARRQTPFAKCEIRWFRPVRAGETLTGSRRVLEKYERRGSRFVTFRVEASNQRGEQVASYDYTCIFSYARGSGTCPATGGWPSRSCRTPTRRPHPTRDAASRSTPSPSATSWRRWSCPRARRSSTARTSCASQANPAPATSTPTRSSPGRTSSAARSTPVRPPCPMSIRCSSGPSPCERSTTAAGCLCGPSPRSAPATR